MIVIVLAGIGFLALAAVIVGFIDSAQSAARREVAAERREKWEAHVLELHGGIIPAEEPDWDDD